MNKPKTKYVVSIDIVIETTSSEDAIHQAGIVMAHGTTESAVGYKSYFVNNVEKVG